MKSDLRNTAYLNGEMVFLTTSGFGKAFLPAVRQFYCLRAVDNETFFHEAFFLLENFNGKYIFPENMNIL